MTTPPRMSAVVAVDAWETAVEAIDALGRQTIAPELEVVVAGPGLLPPDGAARPFASLRVVEAAIQPLSSARARGIVEARAPAVFVAETHGFPRPDCLERLLAAITDGAVAAMPQIANANPGTARSWASLLATYGTFAGQASGTAPLVALHNGAFDRAFLSVVAGTPQALVYGVGISEAIRRSGRDARYVADAVVDHLNVDRVHGALSDRLIGGRLWAGLRSGAWPAWRRLLYAAAFPAGAVVMATRILRSPGWRDHRSATPRGTAALVVAWSLVQSVGEMTGYLGGVGAAEAQHLPLELHRRRYIT